MPDCTRGWSISVNSLDNQEDNEMNFNIFRISIPIKSVYDLNLANNLYMTDIKTVLGWSYEPKNSSNQVNLYSIQKPCLVSLLLLHAWFVSYRLYPESWRFSSGSVVTGSTYVFDIENNIEFIKRYKSSEKRILPESCEWKKNSLNFGGS